MRFSPRRPAIAAAAVIALAALTACGSGGAGGSTKDPALPLPVPAHVTVSTRSVAGLGTILVDGQGRTLYMFPPDAGSKVSCVGACAGTWPPLVLANGATPTAGSAVNTEALSTLADPNTGARIVTYGGYPLYRYAGDVRSGTADGQALFLNGGPWYVMNPAGDPVTLDPGDDR